MKFVAGIFISFVPLWACAACSRKTGEELLDKFASCETGVVFTNNNEVVRIVADEIGECRFCSSLITGDLRHVKVRRPDGGVDTYDYNRGRLESAGSSTSNLLSMVVALFVGDGQGGSAVDRIEFDFVDGKVSSAMRLLDASGECIKKPLATGHPFIDKEYIPFPGMSGNIGPYEWIIVGERREGVLLRHGKKLIEARFILGGKYPWLVGMGGENLNNANRKELLSKNIRPSSPYSNGVHYFFVVDIRNDHVEYFPRDKESEIEKITGQSFSAYELNSFWGYFLSKYGSRRLEKLEAALRAPSSDLPQ